MATLNDLADGLKTRIATIGAAAITVYSEPCEDPQSPMNGASAEITWLDRGQLTGCMDTARCGVDVSVPALDKGWPRAIRLLRQYADKTGALSVQAAIAADRTLGIAGVNAVVVRAGPERIVKYGNSLRWLARIEVEITYGA